MSKKMLAYLAALLILNSQVSYAGEKVICQTGSYMLSNNETKKQAEEAAILQTRKVLADQIGRYIVMNRKVVNGEIKKEEIEDISVGIMKDHATPIVTWEMDENNYPTCKVALEVTVDDNQVDLALKQILQKKSDSKLQEQLQRENANLKAANNKLKKQLKSSSGSTGPTVTMNEIIDVLNVFRKNSEWSKALAFCNKYIDKCPKSKDLYEYRGDAYYNLACQEIGTEAENTLTYKKWGIRNDNFVCYSHEKYNHEYFDLAIKDYEKAYELSGDAKFLYRVALPAAKNGRYVDAINHYISHPKSLSADDFNNFCILVSMSGDMESRYFAMDKLVKLFRRHSSHRLYLQNCIFALLHNEMLKEAIDLVDVVIRRFPKNPYLYGYRSIAFALTGQKHRSNKDFEKMMTLERELGIQVEI